MTGELERHNGVWNQASVSAHTLGQPPVAHPGDSSAREVSRVGPRWQSSRLRPTENRKLFRPGDV